MQKVLLFELRSTFFCLKFVRFPYRTVRNLQNGEEFEEDAIWVADEAVADSEVGVDGWWGDEV